MKSYAFIFARGGSKGLPNKNILNMRGKPLIGYSIEMAKSIDKIDDVFVSTDSDKIAEIGKGFGAKIIKRPKDLALDSSPEIDAWKHAIDHLHDKGHSFDKFISLPATAPLRSKEDVISCIKLLDGNTDVVLAITESQRNPYFNLVKINSEGYTELFSKPASVISRRQDSPKVFDLTTVCYVSKCEYILKVNSIFEGRVRSHEIPKIRSIDIDDEVDFKIANFIMDEFYDN